MKKPLPHLLLALLISIPLTDTAADQRQLVELPPMMQQHMLGNMRDHLRAINEILTHLADENPEAAAEVAENRLGMSSLKAHGAHHMSKFMPEGMRKAGTGMHRAASRLALSAQEGDIPGAYRQLAEVTSACVACHQGYRVH